MIWKTLGESWTAFEARVLPAGASAVQRQEMRRAFYAGAHTVLERMLEIGADDDVTEEGGVDRIQALLNETDVFFRRIGVGGS